MTTDFNAMLEAELDRVSRTFEKVEERYQGRIDQLLVRAREFEEELATSKALVEQLSVALADQNLKRYQALALQGERGYACPHCDKPLSICGQHGPYRRSDENQCPACWRGE